jgi:hypothetical protein
MLQFDAILFMMNHHQLKIENYQIVLDIWSTLCLCKRMKIRTMVQSILLCFSHSTVNMLPLHLKHEWVLHTIQEHAVLPELILLQIWAQFDTSHEFTMFYNRWLNKCATSTRERNTKIIACCSFLWN